MSKLLMSGVLMLTAIATCTHGVAVHRLTDFLDQQNDGNDIRFLLTKRDVSNVPSYIISWDKRISLSREDPRMYSSAFGKRSITPAQLSFESGNDFMDPRLMSSSFGKRSVDPRLFSSAFGKRDFSDPRLLSAAFGKRSPYDPRLMSSAFGKRFSEDPRLLSAAFGKRATHEDPRLFSNAFGKRDPFDPRLMSSAFGKRTVV